MVSKIFIFFFLVVLNLNSQVYLIQDFESTSVSKYKIIMFGEMHGSKKNDQLQKFFLANLYKKGDIILYESRFDANAFYDDFFIKKDSIRYNYILDSNKNKDTYFRFSYIFRKNINIKAIDIVPVKKFYKPYFINYYKNVSDTAILNDISKFNKIKNYTFPNEIKSYISFENFINSFYKNLKIHFNYLKSDSVKVLNYVNGIKATLDGLIDPKVFYYDIISPHRENYMFELLKQEYYNLNNNRIITMNGFAHTKLSRSNNSNFKVLEESFGYLTKSKLDSNIASIYFVCLNKDKSFKKNYPESYQYLKKQLKKDEDYFIKVNYPNSPFRDLIGDYTHLVVFND